MSASSHRFMKITIYYTPFLILCGVIFWFSSMSNPPIPSVFHFPHADKWLHAIAFAAVGAAAALGAAVRKGLINLEVFLEAWILTAIYGFIDEVHQRYTPSRESDIADWLADISGAAIGILLFFALTRLILPLAKR